MLIWASRRQGNKKSWLTKCDFSSNSVLRVKTRCSNLRLMRLTYKNKSGKTGHVWFLCINISGKGAQKMPKRILHVEFFSLYCIWLLLLYLYLLPSRETAQQSKIEYYLWTTKFGAFPPNTFGIYGKLRSNQDSDISKISTGDGYKSAFYQI